MHDPVSVVVPARNEAATIGHVVQTVSELPCVSEVVVVDNASDDNTAAVAEAAGARSVFEPQTGMGHAVRTGFKAATHDWVMKVDADLDKFDTSLFARMITARRPGVGLIKGLWQDPNDNMPMTRLLVMPAINQIAPGLQTLRAPNSGLYVANRSLIACDELIGNYAVDLDVMLRIYATGAEVAEVDIGRIVHDSRNLGHYNAMAEVILTFFLDRHLQQVMDETVVLAQEAGPVIENALGWIASRARAGAVVTLYLDQIEGFDADVLKGALASFPTVSIHPLEQACQFVPREPSTRLRVFSPYPTADEDEAIQAALQVQKSMSERLETELLLIPWSAERNAVGAFQTDIALEVGAGADIKQKAMALARPQAGSVQAPREMFQSYASLPDALKYALSKGGQRDVGNM